MRFRVKSKIAAEAGESRQVSLAFARNILDDVNSQAAKKSTPSGACVICMYDSVSVSFGPCTWSTDIEKSDMLATIDILLKIGAELEEGLSRGCIYYW